MFDHLIIWTVERMDVGKIDKESLLQPEEIGLMLTKENIDGAGDDVVE